MPGYRLTKAAADDLVAIFIESLDQFGSVQADHYHAGLEAAFEFLVEYPRAARLRQEIAPPVRVYPYKSHQVVYELTPDDMIVILRIRHAREDWTSDAP